MPVHNPNNITAKDIPAGWRLINKDETQNPPQDAMVWGVIGVKFVERSWSAGSPRDMARSYITSDPLAVIGVHFEASKFTQFGAITTAIKNASTQSI